MTSMTRRTVIQGAAALACGCPAFAGAAAGSPPPLQRCSHRDVQLLDGPMLDQHRHQQALFLGLDDDALLKPFRSRAGQATPGADLGGWYDDATDFHVDPKDWSTANWHGFIPGHSFGQYMSGLSRGYAGSQDPALKQKISGLVDQYAATISPKFFDDYNLPAYTFDKLVVGLIDAHEYTAAQGASPALAKLTAAALPYLPGKALTREERRALPYTREAQLWDEPYTLPENLLLAAQRGLGAQYRPLALRYVADDSLFDALAAGRSPFAGKHAYSHVNCLSSAFQTWLATGNDKYLAAARNGFAFIQAQSFATGGWGPNETLAAPDDTETIYKGLADMPRSFETPCGAYGHFKIARSLLQATRDPAYGDSMERVLYNTILGARPTQPDGKTFYYSDYSAKAHKGFHRDKWPCCSGTFVQLAADYGISSYFFDARNVYVNLYVPSRMTAEIEGATVGLHQTTGYPFANTSRLTVDVARPRAFGVSLRVPAWAGPGTQIRVNGKSSGEKIVAGTFHTLTRTWRRGDIVEILFDMAPRLEPLNAGHPDMVAVLNGPLVLFPIEAPDVALNGADLQRISRLSDHEWQMKSATASFNLKPFSAISGETYRLYNRITPG